MRESRATAVDTMRRRNASDLRRRPRRVSDLRARIAQNSARSTAEICSTVLPSRIGRNLLKTNDRATLYPSQNRDALFSRERRTLRSRSSSPESTWRGFRSRKELECTRQLESQTWKSEGGFSWQFISL